MSSYNDDSNPGEFPPAGILPSDKERIAKEKAAAEERRQSAEDAYKHRQLTIAEEQTEIAREQAKIAAEQSVANKNIARYTLILVLVGGIGNLVTLMALGVTWQSVQVAADTLKQIKSNDDTTTDQANQIIGNLNWNAQEMRHSGIQAQRAFEVNTGHAKKALDTSIAASRNDQRAWVGVTAYSKALPEAGKRVVVRVEFRNSGRSPALDVSTTGALEPLPQGGLPNFSSLPAPETYDVLQPNTTKYLVLDGTRGSPTGLTPKGVEVLKAGEQSVFVYGIICYKDIFLKQHWTTYCGKLAPETGEFQGCRLVTESVDMEGDKPPRHCAAQK